MGGTTVLQPTEPTETTGPVGPEAEETTEEPWYETVTDSIMQNMMITTLVAGAGLLAYLHVTKKL